MEWHRGETINLTCRYQDWSGSPVLTSGNWCEVVRYSAGTKILLSSGVSTEVIGESGVFSYAYAIPEDFTPLNTLCYAYFHSLFNSKDKVGEFVFKIATTTTTSGAVTGAVVVFDNDMPTAVFD